ncbi:MAG TPA: hypothetical protein VE913_21030 [Longimicrobium sp.]|nr:hypothetical protein [Longimicrobium sp.]
MINVKEAVQAAVSFVEGLYGRRENIELTVEEVEVTEDDQYWLITLGFVQNANALLATTIGARRDYKLFKVNAVTGEVTSMKIRSIA